MLALPGERGFEEIAGQFCSGVSADFGRAAGQDGRAI